MCGGLFHLDICLDSTGQKFYNVVTLNSSSTCAGWPNPAGDRMYVNKSVQLVATGQSLQWRLTMEASRIEETELSKELCQRLLTHFREQVGKVFKIGIIRPLPSKCPLSSWGCLTGHGVFFSSKIESDQKDIILCIKVSNLLCRSDHFLEETK